MKKLFQLFIPLLFALSVFGQKGFRVQVYQEYFDSLKVALNRSESLKDGGKVQNTFIPQYVLNKESTRILANSSANPNSTPTFNWYNGTPATIVANQPIQFIFCTPAAGRMYVIKRIRILTTSDCFLHLNVTRVQANTISGGSGAVNLDGMLAGYAGRIVESTGGTFTFEFNDPLILQSGDRLIVYYYKNSTVGVLSTYSIEGFALTNDTNYSADKTIFVIGDSIGAITSNDLALQSGLWAFIIRDKFLALGKNVRLVNICQGGTNTDIWDWWIKQGRIDNIKADILFINLGMNDAAGTSGLTSGTGYTKIGLKNIVNRYLLFNPKGKVVINNITQTDKTPNITNVAAYRVEIAAAVTEMIASGLPVFLAATDQSFSASDKSNFVSTEQGAGASLHPNEKGQQAMANTIWSVCQNLLN